MTGRAHCIYDFLFVQLSKLNSMNDYMYLPDAYHTFFLLESCYCVWQWVVVFSLFDVCSCWGRGMVRFTPSRPTEVIGDLSPFLIDFLLCAIYNFTIPCGLTPWDRWIVSRKAWSWVAWIDFIGHPIGLDGHPLGLDVWYYVYFCTMVSFIGMSALMSLFGQYSAFSIFHDAESGTK